MKKFFANTFSRSRRRSDPSMGNGASGGSSPTSGGNGGGTSASTSRPSSGVPDNKRTGGGSSARLQDHAISVGGKMLSEEEIQKVLHEKDEIIKRQEAQLKSHVKRIEELEAQAKSLQVF